MTKALFLTLPLMLFMSCKEKNTTEGELAFKVCTYDNQADCEGSYLRCFWSPTANADGRQCFSKDFCESDRPAAVCNAEFGCIYNNDPNNAYCLSPKFSACKDATVEASCKDVWQCAWSTSGKVVAEGVTQHCFGTLPIPVLGYRCSDYPQDICALTGCIYDEPGAKCLSRSTSSCTEFTTEANCSGVGCLWDAGQSKCLSANPVTTKCADFTVNGKTTCEAAGCLFDEKAVPPVCASKFQACANYELPLDSCPVSFGCRVSEDGLRCESENCNFNVTQTDCNAQPGCNWSIYCRNPFDAS